MRGVYSSHFIGLGPRIKRVRYLAQRDFFSLIPSQRFDVMNEGFAGVTYRMDGEIYTKYYPIEEAASLGEDIYDIDLLKLETEEEESENTEPEDDASNNPDEYTYVYLRDFSIEGKWKSVGDSGFGQAQPGAIVAFDGTNCNFSALRTPMRSTKMGIHISWT